MLRATVAQAAPPAQDAQGNTVIPAATAAVLEMPCRAEPTTVDGRRPLRDGTAYECSYTVHAGPGIPRLPIGTQAEITDAATGGTIGTGRVARCDPGQLASRIWLI